MPKPEVKGDLFRNTLSYVAKRWGKAGLDTLSAKEDDFLPQAMYPFGEFCEMLAKIESEQVLRAVGKSSIRTVTQQIIKSATW